MNNKKQQEEVVNKPVRKKYSPEFKEQALARAELEGVRQTAKDLDIAEPMLYSWRAKKKRSGSTFEQQKLQQAELAQLKRDVYRLSQENEFLKKAAAYFAKEQG